MFRQESITPRAALFCRSRKQYRPFRPRRCHATWEDSLGLFENFHPTGPARLWFSSVKANEVIESDESIVVIGDSLPGSKVTSNGSVIVVGRLLGKVHAGAQGDGSAIIAALDLQPQHLQIAERPCHLASLPTLEGPALPMLAYLRRSSEPDSASELDVTRSWKNWKRADSKVWVVPVSRPHLKFGLPAREAICKDACPCMPNASAAALVTAAYACGLGVLVMAAPLTCFTLLFEPSTCSVGFIRLGGALLALFGLYYGGAGVGCKWGTGVRGFFIASVWGRLLLAALCMIWWQNGDLGVGITFFAAVNAIGGLLMWRALSHDCQVASEL